MEHMPPPGLPVHALAPAPRRPLPALPPEDAAQRARRLFGLLRRRKTIGLIVFAAIFGLVVAYTFTRPRLYTATAGMVVNSRELNLAEKDKGVLPDLPTAESAPDTEIEILRSAAVAERTVRALDLVHDRVLAPQLAAVAPDRRLAVATAIVSQDLRVARPGGSNVVAIAYTARDPLLAKQVADETGRQYLAVKQSSRRAAADQVDRGLRTELDSLRSQLEAGEAAVARYKAQHNLLDTDGVTLTEQELSLYKQQDAAARATLAQESARLRTARAQLAHGSNGDDVGAALQSPVVQELRTQRATITTQIADLAKRYRPGHPDLVRAEAQRADIDKAIAAEIHRVVSNLDANAWIAGASAATARATADATSGTLAANGAASVALNELQRRADGLKDTYSTMLERRNAIHAQALIADGDARLLSPALLPLRPSAPNRPLMLMIGLILATLGAGLAIWLAGLLDRGFGGARDVQLRLGLPHLANLPTVGSIARGDERRIAAIDFGVERPISLYGEALRTIWIDLVQDRVPGIAAMIGITSAQPDEGKTTLAISLARASALAGLRTLLIDGDIRRPSVARSLGLRPTHGLVEVLRGDATLDAAAIRDGETGLAILPVAAAQATADALLDESGLRTMLAACRRSYDVVIFDVAPALLVAEARLLLKQLDEVLLAVRWRRTQEAAVQAAIEKLRMMGIEPRGVVLTQVDMKALARSGEPEAGYGTTVYGAE